MNEQIAEMIRQRLKRMGLKQKEFAALMGVKPPMVSKWLTGTVNFTTNTLERMQVILRMSFFDLYFDTNKLTCLPCIVVSIIPVKHDTTRVCRTNRSK